MHAQAHPSMHVQLYDDTIIRLLKVYPLALVNVLLVEKLPSPDSSKIICNVHSS